MNKIVVIIPTYNEADNIYKIINLINDLNLNLDILVVDDNSPDGTGGIVDDIRLDNPNIFIIKQDSKSGLGTAYKKGFQWAIDNQYNKVVQIDADLSHDPNSIPELLSNCDKYDLVVGSRYVKGINVVNWPMSRLLLSYFANKYVRFLTRMPINDSTSGFKCIDVEVLKAIEIEKIVSQGYSFQVEVNFLAWMKKYKVKEIPIIFCDRTIGKSKMSKAIVWEAVFMVPKLACKRIFRL